LGVIAYADDNEGWIPREGYATNGSVQWNNWNAVRNPQSQDVWYNALSNHVGVPSAASYAFVDRRPDFYERASLFQCPSARIPKTTPLIALFSVAMNSQLIEPGRAPTIQFSRIKNPSTVLFLDNLLEDEKPTSPRQELQNLGQPAAMATRFAGNRHGRGGNLAFADGSARWLAGDKVVETTGPGAGGPKLPERDVVWEPK
jgi:prepilin-type processing-associated H-X9-DG protein